MFSTDFHHKDTLLKLSIFEIPTQQRFLFYEHTAGSRLYHQCWSWFVAIWLSKQPLHRMTTNGLRKDSEVIKTHST
eukprot:UN17185